MCPDMRRSTRHTNASLEARCDVDIVRRRNLNLLDEPDLLGPHDDLPLIPDKVDCQLYGSRHRIAQPFFFAGEKEMLLCFLTGRGRVEFRETSVLHIEVEPGDFVRVPPRTPHRVLPTGELLQLRYKARRPGLEAVSFHCDDCGAELFRHEYDADSEIAHEQWQQACEQFNRTAAVCERCGVAATTIDLGPFRWAEIASALAAERV
jgi:hypothetical protein